MPTTYNTALTSLQLSTLEWSINRFLFAPMRPFIGKEQAIAADSYMGSTAHLPSWKQRQLLNMPSTRILDELVDMELLSHSYHGHYKQWGYALTALGKDTACSHKDTIPPIKESLQKLVCYFDCNDDTWRASIRQEEILIEVYRMYYEGFEPNVYSLEDIQTLDEPWHHNHPTEAELKELYNIGLLGCISKQVQQHGTQTKINSYFLCWAGQDYVKRWALVDEDTVQLREEKAQRFIEESQKLAKKLYSQWLRELADQLDEDNDDDSETNIEDYNFS